jgi:hypothetical protein
MIKRNPDGSIKSMTIKLGPRTVLSEPTRRRIREFDEARKQQIVETVRAERRAISASQRERVQAMTDAPMRKPKKRKAAATVPDLFTE